MNVTKCGRLEAAQHAGTVWGLAGCQCRRRQVGIGTTRSATDAVEIAQGRRPRKGSSIKYVRGLGGVGVLEKRTLTDIRGVGCPTSWTSTLKCSERATK